MRIWARLEDGVTRETLSTAEPIEKLFHPALTWVDVTDVPNAIEPDTSAETKTLTFPDEQT